MDRVMASAAGGAMASLLRKVGSLTAEQGARLMGVPAGIEWLKLELKSIHAFLMGLSDIEDPDEVVKCWMDELREVSYDMEDAIDGFELGGGNDSGRASSSFSSTGLFMGSFQRCMGLVKCVESRYAMAGEIQRLRDRVSEAEDRRKRYKLSDDEPAHCTVDHRVVSLYREAISLVGVDGPRDTLISWLMQQRDGTTDVVSIVGFGGIGKTTLAKHIFNTIQGQFDCTAFVTVSRKPHINYIIKKILSQFQTGGDMAQVGLHERQDDHQPFIDLLRAYLRNKRYLVVVDDIWDKDTWEIIKCGLLNNSCGSRIITTTRVFSVATCCCSGGGHIHRMEPLCWDDSRKLFLKRVFDSEVCPPHLGTALDKILKKCSGSPLAILTVSSMLVDKVTPYQWEQVCQSIGSGISQDDDVSGMRRILSHSYFDLPYHLRQCLLYLSTVPEDHVIKRKDLVYRWIGEGFIHGQHGQNITEVGERYFHELINRSLIQPVRIKYDGRASACQVHDTILDFIVSKSVEENYVTILGALEQRPYKKIRRLSIHSYQDEDNFIELEELDLSHVRSLNLFNYVEQIPSALTKLRVLHIDYAFRRKSLSKEGDDEVHEVDLDELIGDVRVLFNLRYLSIQWHFLTERILEQIGNLQCLETLDLREGIIVDDLPPSINKLQCLVRLFIPGAIMPYGGIGGMKALEELKYIDVTKQSVIFLQQLSKLTRLRVLGLYIDISEMTDDMELALMSSLHKLGRCSLHSISFRASESYRVADLSLVPCNYWKLALQHLRKIKMRNIDYVPDWVGSLHNLEKINLYSNKMEQHELDILGGVQSLLHLKLHICKNPLIFSSRKGFQQLKYLSMSFRMRRKATKTRSTRTRMVTFETGLSMPRIQHLDLRLDTCFCYIGRDSPSRLEKHARVCMFSKSEFADFYDMGIQNLSSLTMVSVTNRCCVPMAAELGEAITKRAVSSLPNCSTAKLTYKTEFMYKDNQASGS